MSLVITHPAFLVVEGKDDVEFFTSLARYLSLHEGIQVYPTEGEGNFRAVLKSLGNSPGFENLESLGIVRDADDDPIRSFENVQRSLEQAGLPVPTSTLQSSSQGKPRITVMILPDSNSPRMLEDLCLRAFEEDPAIPCVDQYFDCLKGTGIELGEKNIPKAKIRVFLTSKLDPKGTTRLWLGSAVNQDWWPWHHPAFDEVKDLLRVLASP